ncbi:hypothetical protein ABZ760_08505 [Streptomyces sp. NPDC006658]|uniref:hypothetical protein n=1 Tax=Streptomyces sp. NPDC006658 TaxID=3156900 RepID=UPI0033F8E05E
MQYIDDIGDPDELVAWATAAQLARLDENCHISNKTVARASGWDAGNLATALHREQHRLDGERLRRLDEAICALAPEMDNAGGLTSLSLRLRGLTDRTSLVAHVPCNWAPEMLLEPLRTEFDVLVQASALLTMFMAVDAPRLKGEGIRAIRQRYHEQIIALVDRLIMIGASPPTPRNTDALALVGGLAKYSFEPAKERLHHALQTLPLGFRMWRTVTALVQLSKTNPDLVNRVKPWVRGLLNEADRLRLVNVYPGRSLELELAIAIPPDWSPPGDEDWVHQLLLARARNPTATVRERGTAAHGLWQRALAYDPDNTGKCKDELSSLIQKLRSKDERQDVAGGLQWIAATLEHVIEENVKFCNDWPEVNQPWFSTVNEAADSLDHEFIPPHIQPAAKQLFRHVLLQNAGVERREAIDTLVAGGWIEPIINALQRVLMHEKKQAWIRIRALFALGFLQHRDLTVAQNLSTAFQDAYEKVSRKDSPVTPADISEMHATLFAIGDCFGAEVQNRGFQKAKEQVRTNITENLFQLLSDDQTNTPERYPIARAAAYMLTVTASDRPQPEKADTSEELLVKLGRYHNDRTTKSFCAWALKHRFDSESGKVHPLLQMIE